MHRLREVLGDSAASPRYIETIPRKGYRFIGSLEAGRIRGRGVTGLRGIWEALYPETPQPRHPGIPARRSWQPVLAAALAALVAILGVVAWTRAASPQHDRAVTLVVAPFRAVGGTAAERMAWGLREELITRLGSASPAQLVVYAPATGAEFAARGKAAPLEADFSVTATIEVDGDRLAAGVRLTDLRDHRVAWSHRWDAATRDLTKLQAEMTARIARAAVPRLSDRATRREGTSVPQAFEELAAARARWSEFDAAGFRAALDHAERAVRLDPSYAEGWAAVADAWNFLALFGEVSGEEGFERARTAALRALALNDGLSEGHAALALAVSRGRGELALAEQHLRRAVDLAPGRALNRQWQAGLYTAMGKTKEAIAAAEEARRLDPLSLSVNADLGWYLYYARRFEEAIAQSEKTLALYPDAATAAYARELSLRVTGPPEKALQAMLARRRLEGASDAQLHELSALATRGGMPAAWRMEAGRAEADPKNARRKRYAVAVDYAWSGDRAAALRTLDQAKREKVSWLPYVAADPAFDSLR